MVPKTKSKGKAKSKPVVGPRVPASMPKKPNNAFQHYCSEKQGAGMRIPELLKEYQNLPDKAQREEAANAAKEQYQLDIATWEKSVEGRKYLKAVEAAGKKKKMMDAKARFMKDEPKRPSSSYFIFLEEMR